MLVCVVVDAHVDDGRLAGDGDVLSNGTDGQFDVETRHGCDLDPHSSRRSVEKPVRVNVTV